MKQLLAMVVCIAVCITLASCGTGAGTTASEPSAANHSSDASSTVSDDPIVSTNNDNASVHPPEAQLNGNEVDEAVNESETVNEVQDTSPVEIIEVSFDDLICNMQPDIVFRPWMLTVRAKELDGKRIRIRGHMHGGVTQSRNITEFVLLRNLECKFGPGGQADHLIQVTLKDGTKTSYAGKKIIEVEGTLTIRPFVGLDGNTWSIYEMAGESVGVRSR